MLSFLLFVPLFLFSFFFMKHMLVVENLFALLLGQISGNRTKKDVQRCGFLISLVIYSKCIKASGSQHPKGLVLKCRHIYKIATLGPI